jgi:hypothetical protein
MFYLISPLRNFTQLGYVSMKGVRSMSKINYIIIETNQPSEEALQDFYEVLYVLITKPSTEEKTNS